MCFIIPNDADTQADIAEFAKPQSNLRIEILEARPENNSAGEALCTCNTCAPKLYEAHSLKHTKVLSYRTTRHGDYYKLNLIAHEPLELVEAAIRSFDREESALGASQRRALGLWRSWHAKFFQTLDKDPSHGLWPSQTAMEEAIAILNQFFFLGAIKNVRFTWDESLGLRNLLGQTAHDTWPYVGTVNIAVDPVPVMLHHLSRAHSLLSTLLHEAVHAYIGQLGCAGSGCGEESCKQRFMRNTGKSAHGRAWQWLAEEVERIARRSLGVEVDLMRRWVCRIEYWSSHVELSSHDMSRCFSGGMLKPEEKVPLEVYNEGGLGYYQFAKAKPVELHGQRRTSKHGSRWCGLKRLPRRAERRSNCVTGHCGWSWVAQNVTRRSASGNISTVQRT